MLPSTCHPLCCLGCLKNAFATSDIGQSATFIFSFSGFPRCSRSVTFYIFPRLLCPMSDSFLPYMNPLKGFLKPACKFLFMLPSRGVRDLISFQQMLDCMILHQLGLCKLCENPCYQPVLKSQQMCVFFRHVCQIHCAVVNATTCCKAVMKAEGNFQ